MGMMGKLKETQKKVEDTKIDYKADDSPLTKADLAANAIIVEELEKLAPQYPILSEEEKHQSYETRKGWDTFWLVDPLDGTKEFINRNEAGELFNLKKLPDDSIGEIRIIKIGDYDACPCSGLHVKRTSEIGKFNIYSTSFNNGVLRVRFKLLSE